MALLKRYSNNVRKFVRLPLRDKAVLAESWLELLGAVILIRVPVWRKRVTEAGEDLYTGGRDKEIERYRVLIEKAASHHIKKITCLESSIALRNVLRKRGIRLRLNIGVRREAGEFEAHAWLEGESGSFKELEKVKGDGG